MSNICNVSETRIEWTTQALNSSLHIHKDVQELRIRKEEVEQTFVTSTLVDSNKVLKHIKEKLAFQKRTPARLHRFDPNCFYVVRDPDLKDGRPSNKVEEAFSNVADFYIRHQATWEEADEIEIASDDEVNSEDEEPEYN